jgi:hypothetical protein
MYAIPHYANRIGRSRENCRPVLVHAHSRTTDMRKSHPSGTGSWARRANRTFRCCHPGHTEIVRCIGKSAWLLSLPEHWRYGDGYEIEVGRIDRGTESRRAFQGRYEDDSLSPPFRDSGAFSTNSSKM